MPNGGETARGEMERVFACGRQDKVARSEPRPENIIFFRIEPGGATLPGRSHVEARSISAMSDGSIVLSWRSSLSLCAARQARTLGFQSEGCRSSAWTRLEDYNSSDVQAAVHRAAAGDRVRHAPARGCSSGRERNEQGATPWDGSRSFCASHRSARRSGLLFSQRQPRAVPTRSTSPIISSATTGASRWSAWPKSRSRKARCRVASTLRSKADRPAYSGQRRFHHHRSERLQALPGHHHAAHRDRQERLAGSRARADAAGHARLGRDHPERGRRELRLQGPNPGQPHASSTRQDRKPPILSGPAPTLGASPRGRSDHILGETHP